MTAFATLEELKTRLDWTLSEDEERDAEDALESLSEQARYYGRDWQDAASAPRLVVSLVLAAAKRYLRNPDGYTTSRAGDETLGWTDRGSDAGSATFSGREVKMLEGMAGKKGLTSVPITAWGPMKSQDAGYVPVVTSGWEKPFPFYATEDGPW